MPAQLVQTVAMLSQPPETQQLCRETGLGVAIVSMPYIEVKKLAEEKGVPARTLDDCLSKEDLLRAMAPYCDKDVDEMPQSSLLDTGLAALNFCVKSPAALSINFMSTSSPSWPPAG